MSVVTTITLFVNLWDGQVEAADGSDAPSAVMDGLNSVVRANSVGGILNELGESYGGTKNPEICVYGGAFNHLDVEAFMTALASIMWEDPEDVLLVLHCEEQPYLRLWRPGDSIEALIA